MMGDYLSSTFAARLLVLHFFYCKIIFQSMASNLKGTAVFTSRLNVEVQNTNAALELSAQSFLECGSLCLKSDTCLSFKFDENTRMCEVADVVISDFAHSWYTIDSDCTPETRYVLYRCKDILLCLYINSTQITQAEAEDICRNDGGHLLLITNEAMHTCIQNINDFPTGSPWIDGKDVNKNGTMFSWIGKPIPYVKWAETEPTGGPSYCMRFDVRYGFKDTPCGTRFSYVCQKDSLKM